MAADGKASAPDATYAADSSKPYPGGAVAPGEDHGDEINDELVFAAAVTPQCLVTEEHSLANGESFKSVQVRTFLSGSVTFKTTGALNLSRWLRFAEGEGEGLRCHDILLRSEGDFSKLISATNPWSFRYLLSKESGPGNILSDPPALAACTPEANEKEFYVLDKSGVALTPSSSADLSECQVRARSKPPASEDESGPAPWGGSEIKKPLPKLP